MEGHVKQAVKILKVQANVRNMTEEEINSIPIIKSLAAGIKNASQTTEEIQTEQKQKPAIDPKNVIKEKSVICLECGKYFKVITEKHLAKHDITPQEYKEMWV